MKYQSMYIVIINKFTSAPPQIVVYDFKTTKYIKRTIQKLFIKIQSSYLFSSIDESWDLLSELRFFHFQAMFLRMALDPIFRSEGPQYR